MSGGSVNICEVTQEVKQALKEFRFRKTEDTAALVLKVDREKQQIILDEKLEAILVDDLRESLPGHQPRDSHAELQMMYAGSKLALQQEAGLTRGFEIRELEDLTEEWLLSKLGN